MNPRLYRIYRPAPNRTLQTKRTWHERVLDLRHATGLGISELSALTRIDDSSLCACERNPRYRPHLPFILAIRRMEEIFKEELIQYLKRPHGRLIQREQSYRSLLPYGGYSHRPRNFKCRATVSFEGRTFADIAAMEDLEAIRALKRVKVAPPIPSCPPPERSAYGRIIEAASRGNFMSLDEVSRLVKGDQDAPA